MSTLDDRLRRAAQLAPAPTFDLEDVRAKRERRARNRRLRAGVFGVAVAASIVLMVVAALRVAPGTQPAAGFPTRLPEATVPPLVAGPAEYYYLRTVGAYANRIGPDPGSGQWAQASDYVRGTSEVWRGVDGSGRVRTDWEIDRLDQDKTYGPGELVTDSDKPGLANLPTQPLELRSYLLGPAAFGGSPVAAAPPSSAPEQSPESVRLTRIIADLLTENLTRNALTPAQRIAIVEVLSSLDGVTVDLRSLDPAGRPAYELVFETTSGPTRYQVFVDPASHDVLAVLETIPRNGDVTNATIVESVSIVASTDKSDQTGESAIPAPDPTVLDRWLRLGRGVERPRLAGGPRRPGGGRCHDEHAKAERTITQVRVCL